MVALVRCFWIVSHRTRTAYNVHTNVYVQMVQATKWYYYTTHIRINMNVFLLLLLSGPCELKQPFFFLSLFVCALYVILNMTICIPNHDDDDDDSNNEDDTTCTWFVSVPRTLNCDYLLWLPLPLWMECLMSHITSIRQNIKQEFGYNTRACTHDSIQM